MSPKAFIAQSLGIAIAIGGCTVRSYDKPAEQSPRPTYASARTESRADRLERERKEHALDPCRIFAGNASCKLAQAICENLKVPPRRRRRLALRGRRGVGALQREHPRQ